LFKCLTVGSAIVFFLFFACEVNILL
jgi:hypothetical protein